MGLYGYDFTHVKLPEKIHAKEQSLGLDFAGKAHGLVLHDRTGHGKSHLAIAALGMQTVERGMKLHFHQTAELVLQLS